MEIAEDKGLIPIRVLVADDHEAMLGRVATLLAIEFNVVGTVTDGQQALDATLKLSPDVLVLDIIHASDEWDGGGPSLEECRVRSTHRLPHHA